MAFAVVYDACVLHPAPLRDLLIRIARKGLVRAKWTDATLDECFRSILANEPERKPESLARTRALMNLAVQTAWSPATKTSSTASSYRTPTTGTSLPRQCAVARK